MIVARPARPLIASLVLTLAFAIHPSEAEPPLRHGAVTHPSDAPPPTAGTPDPSAIFAPFDAGNAPNAYRSASGRPGPAYWQNRVDTTIAAAIDPATHVLRGSETLAYVNNSPDPLDVLWVQLDQDIYRRDSRARFTDAYLADESTDGDVIESVRIAQDGRMVDVPYRITDTRMRIDLPSMLAAKGGKIRLQIAWHYTVPGPWGGRTAVTPSSNGDIYEIGQWFPRMAVYDDLRGWDTAPYLGQEFYLEYGDIDYSVTVPRSFIVEGSGALLNPDQVLTATQRARLARAAASDRTVMIRAPSEVKDPSTRPAGSGPLTWHFRMNNTRDVAFAASAAFAWDAARIALPPVSPAPGAAPVPRLAMSIYPVEAARNWERSTEYVKHAIEYFSEKWYAYPWPDAVNLAGHGAGMEYPGMAFDGIDDKGAELFWITTHELGHGWFPMIVGSNERRNAFVDEGFNTFIDVYASDHFNHGEFAPKRDPEYAPGGGNPVDEIIPWLRDPNAPAMLAPSDQVIERYRHPITYFKSALGLVLLREQILGPDRFDPAFRRYIAAWAYKHPTPYDFFRFMDSEAGEDLSWWWRGWYQHNWTLDLGLAGAAYVDGDPAKGLDVTLVNKGWLVMPARLRLTADDGTESTVTVPVESWMKGNSARVRLPTRSRMRSIELDADHALPDTDRGNNVLTLPP